MNPLVQAALGSILRAGLFTASGWLIQHGIWTHAQADTYVSAATLWLLSFGWALWKTYSSRLKFLLALEADPNATERDIKAQIATTSLKEKLSTALGSK